MPAGVVTANQIHGSKLQGYFEGVIATAGTFVAYAGPSAPVNVIYSCKKTTAATEPALTVDWANPGTGANAGKMKVFASTGADGETFRITWVYAGG